MDFSEIHYGKEGRVSTDICKAIRVVFKVKLNGFLEVLYKFVKCFPLREDIKVETSSAVKLAIRVDLGLNHFFHAKYLDKRLQVTNLFSYHTQ